jgi:hypothetical protein
MGALIEQVETVGLGVSRLDSIILRRTSFRLEPTVLSLRCLVLQPVLLAVAVRIGGMVCARRWVRIDAAVWPPITRAFAPLLVRSDPARGGRRRCRGGDGKCQPCVPAGGPVRAAKFRVGLEIDVTLKALAEREDVAKLRTDAEYLRLETSDVVA